MKNPNIYMCFDYFPQVPVPVEKIVEKVSIHK